MPCSRPRDRVPAADRAAGIDLIHRVGKLLHSRKNDPGGEDVAHRITRRRITQIGPRGRQELGGVGQIDHQVPFVAELPGPDGARVLVAVDDLRGEFPHLLARHAVAHRQLVEALAGEVGKREGRPEEGWHQPHAVPLGRGHHRVESPEIFRAVGEEQVGVDRLVTGEVEAREGQAPLAQGLKTGLVGGVRRIPQHPVKGVEIVHAEPGEGPVVQPQGAVRVHGQGRRGAGHLHRVEQLRACLVAVEPEDCCAQNEPGNSHGTGRRRTDFLFRTVTGRTSHVRTLAEFGVPCDGGRPGACRGQRYL